MYALVKTFRTLASGMNAKREALRQHVAARSGMSMAALTLMAVLAAPQAQAVVTRLDVTVLTDGTPGPGLPSWDAAAGPGFDTGPNNGVVRTNDEFEYKVTIRTNTQADNNVRIVSTLPSNQTYWMGVPTACDGAGSNVSSDGLTLTCVVANIGPSTTRDIVFKGFVRGTARHDTQLAAPNTVVESSANGASGMAPTLNAGTLRVSAAPFYDAVVQMSYQGNPQAYGYSLQSNAAGNLNGFYHRPMVGLIGRNPSGYGRKGVEQLQGSVNVTVDLAAGFPSSALLGNWNGNAPAGQQANGTFVVGSQPVACGSAGAGRPSVVLGSSVNNHDRVVDTGGNSSASNTVPNGGSCAVAKSGQQITVTLSGMDTTMQRRPTITGGSAQNPIHESEWWVSNKTVVLWTPEDAYPQAGTVTHTFKLAGLSGTSISGQPIKFNEYDNPNNNTVSYDVNRTLPGGVSKYYIPDTRAGLPYNSTPDPGHIGDHIVNYMAARQVVGSRVLYSNPGGEPHSNVYLCEVIDRTAFNPSTHTAAPLIATALRYRGSVESTDTSGITIQYGRRKAGRYFPSTGTAAGPGTAANATYPGNSEYQRASCFDSAVEWFSTAAAAGDDLVYIRARFDQVPGGHSARLYVYGLEMRDTWANTISVQGFGGDPQTPGLTRTGGQAIEDGSNIRNVAMAWLGTENSSTRFLGTLDHVQFQSIKTTSRVSKKITSHSDPMNLPLSAGTEVEYTLSPRLSTTFPKPNPANVFTYTVTDTLPAGMTYVAGSATGSGWSAPTVNGDPSSGQTLTWTRTAVEPFLGNDGQAGAALPDITFKATINHGVPNDSVLVNNVEVNAARAIGGALQNTDYETCVAGQACVKTGSASLKVQTTAAVAVRKTTTSLQIQPGQDFNYEIAYRAPLGNVSDPNIPELIDILPYVGDGVSDPARDFQGRADVGGPGATVMTAGAYKLKSVTGANGEEIRYTNRAPNQIHNNPRHASNQTGGATRWCLASEFGSAGCPANIGQATAVRVNPTLTTMQAGVWYPVQMVFETNATVAKQGDLYSNSVGGHSVDSGSTLQFVHAFAQEPVKILGGANKLSGKVYYDANDNGQIDSGEVGIAGNTLTLYACTGGANGVVDTTDMGTAIPPTCTGDDQLLTLNASTDTDGNYSFSSLQNGLYKLVQPTQPAGYDDGKTTAGSAGGTATAQGTTPSSITNIALTGSTDAQNNNFGEVKQTIVAEDDDMGRHAVGGAVTTPSVLLDNGNGTDKANGAAATTSNVTIQAGTPSNPALTMDTTTGVITVAAGTPAGVYLYPYKICLVSDPNVCDDAVATVTLVGIDAVDDNYSGTPIDSATGGNTPSVLANDDANGTGATTSNVTLTPGTPSNTGLTMNPDGSIMVAPGTPAGTHTYPYTICLVSDPNVCDTATATVVVSAQTIVAEDDDMGRHAVGGAVTTPSVLLDNGNGTDKANGAAATTSNVTIQAGTPSNPALTMDTTTGVITVAAGTPAGVYLYPYKICLVSDPNVCDDAVATVTLVGIDAVDDNYSGTPIDSATGGNTPSVLANDDANGTGATTSNVTLTPGTPSNTGLTMNPDGSIMVAPGTPAGTHTYPYTICLVSDPNVCDTATATVVVSAPASADLGVTKVVDNATAAVGEEVTFTITVTNHGPSAAADVTVAEQLPSGYTLVSATATAGSYSAPTWTIGTLANGAVETLTLKATVNATGDYTNTATVSSRTPEGNPNNDTDSAKVTP
ncbi:hypothetical protein CO614_05865, partial [Lysobacteraceae bacterium NML120232]